MRAITFGRTRIEIDDASARTTLHDGKQIPAIPHSTPGYLETAERLGYGTDTASLCVQHELTHVALAQWLGLLESPVMRSIVEGDGASELTELEESAVLAIQAYANEAGVNLTRRLAKVTI